MLTKLRNMNLGSLNYFYEFLSLFYDRPNVKWDQNAIDDYFRGKTIDNNNIFDGAIPLMIFADIIECNSKGIYSPSSNFQTPQSKKDFEKTFLIKLFEYFVEDNSTYDFFSTKEIKYDLVHNQIQLKKSSFGFKYANIRDLLISLDFLQPHPYFPQNTYLINKKYKKIFENYFSNKFRKQLTPEDLERRLEKQKENGIIAEDFVLKYEKKRTGRNDEIELIANFDVSAGFDVLSFEDKLSQEHDRFIEVKAYQGNKAYFYWSRNEMEVARHRKNQYFLYLVNLDEIHKDSYHPKIIKNPATEIFASDKWEKTIENYLIHLK